MPLDPIDVEVDVKTLLSRTLQLMQMAAIPRRLTTSPQAMR